MKQVIMFKCNYCRKVLVKSKAMAKHEHQCIHNPFSINCYRCKYAYESEVYNCNGYSTHQLGAHCPFLEGHIKRNMAYECKHYERTDSMYYTKNLPYEEKESEGE